MTKEITITIENKNSEIQLPKDNSIELENQNSIDKDSQSIKSMYRSKMNHTLEH